MSLFSFTHEGEHAFEDALKALSSIDKPTDADYEQVRALADVEALRSIVEVNVHLPEGPFETRFDLCSRLFDALEHTEAVSRLNPGDGLWSWLTAHYFNELTTFTTKSGKTKRWQSKEKEFPAYIWRDSFEKGYRHRIGHGLFMIRHLGKDISKPMLISPPGSMSNYCEQTFARIGSYRERTVIEAANSIYFDGHRILPGSAGERRWALQHFHREVAQYLLNYELHQMTKEELLDLLDRRFKDKAFRDWDTPCKVVAGYIALNASEWVEQLLDDPADNPLEAIAEQLGCKASDLSKLVDQASARLAKSPKKRAVETHWADRFCSHIKKNRVKSSLLTKSVRKLLVGASSDDIGDDLLDELLELVETNHE